MKKFLSIFLSITIAFLAISCANEKVISINNENVLIETYGWADYQEKKDDRILYHVNVGNIVWSVITLETIIVPVILTGWYLFEPIDSKENIENKTITNK